MQFICKKTGIDLMPLFNQYLRTTQIPKLEYKVKNDTLSYRYTNCNKEFNMPLKVKMDDEFWIKPTTDWQSMKTESKIAN